MADPYHVTMPPSVVWFRRDLRLHDHPAVAAAAGGPVAGLFVIDPRLWGPAGAARRAFLAGCLRRLHEGTGGRLVVRYGDPAEVVPAVAREAGAAEVVVTDDFGPYGQARDDAVEQALARETARLRRIGSPYAVAPGLVTKADGEPYRVYSAFYRAWRRIGWPVPEEAVDVDWVDVAGDALPVVDPVPAGLPPAGEAAAHEALDRFLAEDLEHYAANRNAPAADATSRLSPYLKWGCLHPRQVLVHLGEGRGPEAFRREIAWREFYADVLFHAPDSARQSLRPEMRRLRADTGADADRRFEAWVEGRTGFPLVDAGMRQLAAEAWMHNRIRMLVASFLVKDLHIDWRRGARLFLDRLVDADLASNNHGWQWVAGTGTDPMPFARVFNPVTQSKRFDREGHYIRRWVPELAGLGADAVHEPWKLPGGPPGGYPSPMVDHAAERLDAIGRWESVRADPEI
jgi:deoxyribodipyrimidine photo-lyase